MADIRQLLADGGWAIIGVAVGAGLTYWFGAMNRRHQEAREDKTRWYDTRFQAYAGFFRAVVDGVTAAHSEEREVKHKAGAELSASLATVRFVASSESAVAAQNLFSMLMDAIGKNPKLPDASRLHEAVLAFGRAARKDLGLPEVELLSSVVSPGDGLET